MIDYSRRLRDGMRRAHWHSDDLWVAGLAFGSTLGQIDVARIAAGSKTPSSFEYNVLAAALNEHFTDRGQDKPVRYWDDPPNAR